MPDPSQINAMAAALDPDFASRMLQAQRAEQLGTMFSQQAGQVLPPQERGTASWTQVLAKALQGGLAGHNFKKAQDLELQNLHEQGGLVNSLLGSGPSAPQPAPTPPPQGLGPTPSADGSVPQPSAPPAAPAAPAARQGGLPSLTGDPNRDRLMALTLGLPAYVAAVAKRYEPTDLQKNLGAAGLTGPAAQHALVEGAVPPRELARGTSGITARDASGNTVFQDLPGAAESAAARTAGEEAAKVSQTPHYVENPMDVTRPLVTYATPPGVAPAILPPGPGAGASTAGGASGGAQAGAPALPPSPSPSSLPARPPVTAGTVKGMEAGAGEGQKYAVSLNEAAENALEGKRTISEMANLLPNFTPGKGAPVLAAMGAVAQALGVPADFVQQHTGMNVGDAEAFQKGTAALATEAAKRVSSRVTQMEFQTFMKNNPNWMLTPEGVKRVMDFMDKGFDQPLAMQNEFSQWSKANPADRWHIDFPAHWNQQQIEKIKSGSLNSVPGRLTGYRTSSDVASGPPAVYEDGHQAHDPASGTDYRYSVSARRFVPASQWKPQGSP
jgi:hypothetical protein